MPPTPHDMRYDTIQLALENVQLSKHLPTDIEIQVFRDANARPLKQFVVMMTRELVAYRGNTSVERKIPADWWGWFKQRWFPVWLLKRFPIKFEHKKYDATIIFDEFIQKHGPLPKQWGHTYATFLPAKENYDETDSE